LVLSEGREKDFNWQVRNALNFNMEVTALYVLVAAVVVPALRHWWVMLPSSIWILLLLAEAYAVVRQAGNKWSTLTRQIKYLSDNGPRVSSLEKGATAS
jgi:hypothetical protein